MPQPQITLTDGATTLTLDPDLFWSDEHSFAQIEQVAERGLTGKLIIYQGLKVAGRPITLQPPADDAAWMPSSVLTQLRTWESQLAVSLQLDVRGTVYDVIFRRVDGPPIDAKPVAFVADPQVGGFGDWWLVTLRFLTV